MGLENSSAVPGTDLMRQNTDCKHAAPVYLMGQAIKICIIRGSLSITASWHVGHGR